MKTVALTCATPIIKKKKKNQFHLRMSLIKFYKISALEYMSFYMFFTCLMKWDVFIKNFCKLRWSLWGKFLCNWIVHWTSSFLVEHFLLEIWLFKFEYLVDIFLKRREVKLSLQGRSLTVIKFKLSCKN